MKHNLESIIKTMPLEEKIAQIHGCVINDLLDGDKLSLEKCKKCIPHGIGHICQFGTSTRLFPDQLAKIIYEIQMFVKENTVSKIPVLFHEEAIDGPAIRGVTNTPQMLGLSCSWNPMLAFENAAMSAKTLLKIGSRHALSPMIDVITDARWGRGEEGYGEDPGLVARFGVEFAKGLQENGVAATGKHFAGYGVENQDPEFFMNDVLLPFEALIRKADVKAVMPGYHIFHNVPSSANYELINDYLKTHLGFKGLVVSDYWAVRNAFTDYKYADSMQDAAEKCIKAGIDVDFPTGDSYINLLDSVKSGKIEERTIDNALLKVLELKESVGYLDIDFEKPEEHFIIDTESNRQQALKCAKESIVLLKNNGVLPLKKKRIALVGPNSDSYYSLLGDYTWGTLTEFFFRTPADRDNPKLITLYDALKSLEFKDYSVTYERGCDWQQADEKISATVSGDIRLKDNEKIPLEKIPETNYKKAIDIANSSDVIIAAMGENRYLCGECVNRENISLPGIQEKFVEDLCKTGKPVILVVFGGRPMAISKISEKCAAVLYAWYPGEEGGTAVAKILTGEVNPTAKLTVTIPNTPESVPINYTDLTKIKKDTPVFPFGFGLSYTKYEYSDFKITDKSKDAGYFDVEFNVKNIGERDGIEISQIYCEEMINDNIVSKILLGYSRSEIKKGETHKSVIRVPVELLAKYNKERKLVLNPLTIKVSVGSSSQQIYYSQKLNIELNKLIPEKRTEFFATQIR